MLASSPDEVRTTISERLLLQRRRRKLSQRKLAEMIGKGLNFVTRLENAQRPVLVDDLYLLAAELDCDVEYLLGIQDTPRRTEGEASMAWMSPTPPEQGVLDLGDTSPVAA